MERESISRRIILGRAGVCPGVEILNTESLEILDALELPIGQSVYSCCRIPREFAFIAGCKSGEMYRAELSRDGGSPLRESRLLTRLAAPILGVSPMNDQGVAVVDACGSVHAVDTNTGQISHLTSTEQDGATCSVVSAGTVLAGLRPDGSIWARTGGAGRPRRLTRGPRPTVNAFSRLLYAQNEDAVLYPGTDGELVSIPLHGGRGVSRQAHPRGWTSIFLLGAHVFSIGSQEGLVKRWNVDSGEALEEIPCPKGIVCAQVLDVFPLRLLGIDRSGKAIVMSHRDGRLVVDHTLPHGDYRSCATALGSSEVLDIAQQRTSIRAEALTRKALELRADSEEDLRAGVQIHQELCDIGYGHVSLSIQAGQANQQGDLVACLSHGKELLAALDLTKPEALPAILRHIRALERCWQTEQALELLRSLGAEASSSEHHMWFSMLSEVAAARIQTDAAVLPAVPLSTLIGAADIVGAEFVGCWLLWLGSWSIIESRDVDICAIRRKYLALRQQGSGPTLPSTRARRITVISRGGIMETAVLPFSLKKRVRGMRAQLWFQVERGPSECQVRPMLAVNIRKASHSHSLKEHNDQVLRLFEENWSKPEESHECESLMNVMRDVMRRVATDGLRMQSARREEQNGAVYFS